MCNEFEEDVRANGMTDEDGVVVWLALTRSGRYSLGLECL